VIVDVTFAAPAYRAEALAERAHVPALFVECAASHGEIVRRLTARARRADEISDAGVATYLRQRGEFVALNEIPQSSHLVVDTERDLEAASEWLVDNFQVVEEQIREIRDDLPRGFYSLSTRAAAIRSSSRSWCKVSLMKVC
jgi:hypothetical protein